MLVEPYLQDFRRYCAAISMLRHGTRPATVRQWLGFSRPRVRLIVKTYNETRTAGQPRCEPGPPPRALGKLLKDPQLRRELTVAAGLCRILEVLKPPADPKTEPLRTVEGVERLCNLFDLYKRRVPNGQLTLEYLMVLADALHLRDRWALERCSRCDSFLLIDPLSLEPRICDGCSGRARRGSQSEERAVPPEVPPSVSTAGFQHSLF